MTTHWSVLWLTPRSCWIDGRATFTIAMSSTTMNWAAQTSARTTPRVLLRTLILSASMLCLHRSKFLVFNKLSCSVQRLDGTLPP